MIEVTFDFNDLKLTVKGHASAGREGEDIVCSAASILALTLAQAISDMHKCGMMTEEPTVVLEHGDACIACKPNEDSYGSTLNAYLIISRGYKLLAYNCSEYVRYKEIEQA